MKFRYAGPHFLKIFSSGVNLGENGSVIDPKWFFRTSTFLSSIKDREYQKNDNTPHYINFT